MTIDAFLGRLERLGVELHLDGTKLRCSAPKGVLTPALQAELSSRKAELLAVLQQREAARHEVVELRQVSRDEHLPLSFAQLRLWMLDQLQPGTPLYNISTMVEMSGALDEAALEAALTGLVARHEVLRTTFVALDGTPVQVIQPPQPLPLPRVVLPPDDPDALAAHVQAEAVLPFALAHGPLLRARLLRRAPQRHVLLLTLHHSIADGWSMGVLLHDLAQLYAAARQQQPAALPALPIQYADFAAWQRQQLQGGHLDTLLRYWQPQLAGAPPLCTLPSDAPRPPVQRFHGAKQRIVLPLALSDAVQALSQREGVTLFMTLLAAFLVLVGRHTGQTDLVVGTPVAGRTRAELEGLIGCFVNTLVLRTTLDGDPPFATLLARVRAVCLQAYAHQELPFEKLVEVLQPQRDPSHTPLFQLMFALQNAPMPSLNVSGMTLSAEDTDTETAKFDLTLDMRVTADGLAGWWEYNTELYTATTVERLAEQYATLLAGIVAAPHTRLSALPLCPPAQQALLDHWNATAAPYPADTTLAQCFEAQVARTPDALALRDAHDQLSYAQLNQRANQLALLLKPMLHGSQPVVAVFTERTPAFVVAVLAVLKAGAAYLPLDPAYPPARRAFMLHDAQVAACLTQAALVSELPDTLPCPVLVLDQLPPLPAAPLPNPPAAPADQPAYVIYTSGSSGPPKGVLGRQAATLNRCAWMWQHYPFAPDEVVCLKTPVSFVDAVWELFGGLLQGIPTVLIPSALVPDLPRFVAALADAQVTRLVLVPSLLQALLTTLPDLAARLPRLQTWISSGEALPATLVAQFQAQLPGRRLLNLYGASEVAADVTVYDTAEPWGDAPLVPLGRPIANTQLYVLNADARPLPLGAAGELYVGGANLAQGYLHRAALTAQQFVPDPFGANAGGRLYRTGDWARYRVDGTLEYLGRRDQQVKIRGMRVELAEVTQALHAQPDVREAVVVAQTDGGATTLVGYVVPTQAPGPSAATLHAGLRTRLPEYMVPAQIVLLDALPLTPSGKVDRQALPLATAAVDPTATYVAPRTAVETAVAAQWTAVLGREPIGVEDNFFTLGGHSLLATQVLARLENTFHVPLPLAAFFLVPTVAGLADMIEQSRADQSKGSVSPQITRREDRSIEELFAEFE